MTEGKLRIRGAGRQWEALLDPAGAIVGRSSKCDLVLPSRLVSNNHARIYRDPFGRWIVEDLDSKNGVWINGKQVKARAVLPGEAIEIGPFALFLSARPSSRMAPNLTASKTLTIVGDDPGAPLTVREETAGETLSGGRIRQLNEITDRLTSVASSADLYPMACRSLATSPESAALVLRLPAGGKPLPGSPQVLACYFGATGEDGTQPSAAQMRLSRRVLEAVRSGGTAVMATNLSTSGGAMDLTVVDRRRPRAVMCVPVTEMADTADALYLDVPADRAGAEALDFVRAVARQVGFAAKELMLAEERASRKALDRELEQARHIQMGLTPRPVVGMPGVEVAFHYQSAVWVGGDYCDVWPLEDGRLAFAVGDVMGHGLAAAMVMANLHAALRTMMSFCSDVSEVMDRASRHLGQHMPEGMFVTLFLGLYEPDTGRLEYVNAGHPPPLGVRPAGPVMVVEGARNRPLGVIEGSFSAGTTAIDPSAGLVIVTDGILEAPSPGGERFGGERLREILEVGPTDSAEAMVNTVATSVADFRQSLPQQDDITVFALLRHGPAGSGKG